MAFTAKDVQALREKTGVGMMDCKKALTEADGDMEKAVEFLREKGLAAAAKKAGLDVVAEENSSSADDTEYSSQLQKIQAAGAEFLYAPYYYSVAGPYIIPQDRSVGYKGYVMGPDGYDGLKMTDDKSLYNKVLYTTHYSPDDTSNAKVQDFIKSYKKANKNADPNTFTALGYDSVYMMKQAIEKAGYLPGRDFVLAMDAASSEWKGSKKGEYKLPKCGKVFTSEELVEHWKQLVEKYPIYSIEDGLDEEDWEGWQHMTKELGGKVQLVGDDLFVTNTERLSKGIRLGCGNSILIKLNQIGSVSETLEAIKMAHKAGYTAISSHRSGETEDTTIADLAVALNTCQIKTGAPSRTDRVAKYNQLLRIEEELGDVAQYPGMKAFFNLK